ncbi:MAG TPA: hypothetical protein VKS79_01425 [Gemmataceae bacterium]|nr:hypothetical protein [Gemmataceae bacterium]
MTTSFAAMIGIPWQIMVLVVCSTLVFVLVVVGLVLRSRKPRIQPEARLDEDLGEYPPAPPAGTHRLSIDGQSVRIRLVVLAPSGTNTEMDSGKAEGILESIFPGLGSVAQLDKPRIRIWPPQLSQKGFAPTFFRHIHRPEADQPFSQWILVAGPARVGPRVALLGLALQSSEPSSRGNVNMQVDRWSDTLRIQVVS